jgi:hypothetical protein
MGNGPGLPVYRVYVYREGRKFTYSVNEEPRGKKVLAVVTYEASLSQNFWRLKTIDARQKITLAEIGSKSQVSLYLIRAAIEEYAIKHDSQSPRSQSGSFVKI